MPLIMMCFSNISNSPVLPISSQTLSQRNILSRIAIPQNRINAIEKDIILTTLSSGTPCCDIKKFSDSLIIQNVNGGAPKRTSKPRTPKKIKKPHINGGKIK